jgi:hypothetical protein
MRRRNEVNAAYGRTGQVVPSARRGYRAHAGRGFLKEMTMKKLIIALAILLASAAAVAHSGGTDKNGCHRDHKTGDYHCH